MGMKQVLQSKTLLVAVLAIAAIIGVIVYFNNEKNKQLEEMRLMMEQQRIEEQQRAEEQRQEQARREEEQRRQEDLERRAESAITQLKSRMESEARDVAKMAHPASNVEDITIEKFNPIQQEGRNALVYADYNVYMSGMFLGLDKFLVNVSVTGEIRYSNDTFDVIVKGSHKNYDHVR